MSYAMSTLQVITITRNYKHHQATAKPAACKHATVGHAVVYAYKINLIWIGALYHMRDKSRQTITVSTKFHIYGGSCAISLYRSRPNFSRPMFYTYLP